MTSGITVVSSSVRYGLQWWSVSTCIYEGTMASRKALNELTNDTMTTWPSIVAISAGIHLYVASSPRVCCTGFTTDTLVHVPNSHCVSNAVFHYCLTSIVIYVGNPVRRYTHYLGQ